MAGIRQAEKSIRTRERVLESTVEVIRREGLQSASPVLIARESGFSWGAVQHHFGSKEDLLRAVVGLCREEYIETVSGGSYAGTSLAQRVSIYADRVAALYHSDLFLAAVEIAFWQRNNGASLVDYVASDDGRDASRVHQALEVAFGDADVPMHMVREATFHLHCVLTGLAYQRILSGGDMRFAAHLVHAKRTMMDIITGPAT